MKTQHTHTNTWYDSRLVTNEKVKKKTYTYIYKKKGKNTRQQQQQQQREQAFIGGGRFF